MNKEELTFALCPMSNQAKWELINQYETVEAVSYTHLLREPGKME